MKINFDILRMRRSFSIILLLLTILTYSCQNREERTLLFVGSFTDKQPGPGINIYEFDTPTGDLKLTYTVDSIINASYLRLSPNGKYLYSVIESQMDYPGKVAAYKIDSLKGTVKFLNKQDAGGRNPAHLEIDKKGRYLITSTYTDPGLSIFNLDSDGSIKNLTKSYPLEGSSIIEGRQESAHIHSSNISPDGKYLFAQDLGADKIWNFKINNDSNRILTLTEEDHTSVRAGSGPRHFTFHPTGKYGYGIAELSGKVTAYKYTNDGLDFIEDYASYRERQDIYRAADIHISPDGKFLYTSNRGPAENSIGIFSIDLVDGKLKLVGHESTYGDHPRNFTIDPSGHFLLVANQFSDNIVVFRRNLNTGKLTKLPNEISIDNPSSLQMYTYKI